MNLKTIQESTGRGQPELEIQLAPLTKTSQSKKAWISELGEIVRGCPRALKLATLMVSIASFLSASGFTAFLVSPDVHDKERLEELDKQFSLVNERAQSVKQ